MVLRSQRDGLGSSSQAPRGRTSGTRGDIDVPAVGAAQWSPGARLERQSVSKWGLSVWCNTHLAPRLGRGRGRRHRVLGPDPAAHWRRERGMGMWRRGLAHCHPRPLGTRRKRKLLLWSFGYRGPVAEQNKNSPPGPPPGEGVVLSPSPEEQDPEAPGRPSQGRRLPWHFTGLAGAEAGRAAFLWPAPCCGHCEGCCCGRAGAEVEAAGGRLRRRAGGGAAAGGGAGDSSDRRGRMWRNASVCFCAAENCWAKSSTASPNRPAWEIGESRKRCLSDSLISAKVSHRWRSWTTNVDIVWPRARAVTFVALARGPSLCAVPATHLGQHHPRAAVSTPWPGGPAGGPWRAGRERPVQQHRKPWPLERTRTYRPWTEGADYPSRRQRPAGKAAWQWRARLGGPPHTPGPLRRRGWWGRRRH